MENNIIQDRLKVVYCSQGPLAAEVVRSKLEVNGIQVLLRYPSIGRVFALTVDGVGLVEVLVDREDEEKALLLLAEDQDSQLE